MNHFSHSTNIDNHFAIYIPAANDKSWFLESLDCAKFPEPLQFMAEIKGFHFTAGTLKAFIKEEIIHDRYSIIPINGISLSTSSEGEQKKAMLYHLLSQQPRWLLLDDIFDNLDTSTKAAVAESLHTAAAETIIIQLFSRLQDALPFIKTHWIFCNKELTRVNDLAMKPVEVDTFQNMAVPPPIERMPVLPNPLIRMTQVTVRYNDRCILNDINWQINNGEFWQLKGPNGSGKTTLLSMIYGDNSKAYGQNIFLFGYQKGTGETVWEIKKNIGYFSQAMMRFFERPDSAENMIAGGFADTIGLYQKPPDSVMKLANEWMRVLNLPISKKQPFVLFSPAHQRMILIARAMIKHPRLLILDEPTAGLNDVDAALVVSLINKIAAETTTAIIFVSHRTEPELKPDFVFELLPGKDGSTGKKTVE